VEKATAGVVPLGFYKAEFLSEIELCIVCSVVPSGNNPAKLSRK